MLTAAGTPATTMTTTADFPFGGVELNMALAIGYPLDVQKGAACTFAAAGAAVG
jgi:hypothetical protein